MPDLCNHSETTLYKIRGCYPINPASSIVQILADSGFWSVLLLPKPSVPLPPRQDVGLSVIPALLPCGIPREMRQDLRCSAPSTTVMCASSITSNPAKRAKVTHCCHDPPFLSLSKRLNASLILACWASFQLSWFIVISAASISRASRRTPEHRSPKGVHRGNQRCDFR